MAPIDKACWTLLASLTMASVVSCGKPSGPGDAFKPATAADPSPPKGAPAGSLPSLVVSGEVATFKAPTSTEAGPLKRRDTAGTLPGHVAAVPTAVHAPGVGQEPASRMATP